MVPVHSLTKTSLDWSKKKKKKQRGKPSLLPWSESAWSTTSFCNLCSTSTHFGVEDTANRARMAFWSKHGFEDVGNLRTDEPKPSVINEQSEFVICRSNVVNNGWTQQKEAIVWDAFFTTGIPCCVPRPQAVTATHEQHKIYLKRITIANRGRHG